MGRCGRCPVFSVRHWCELGRPAFAYVHWLLIRGNLVNNLLDDVQPLVKAMMVRDVCGLSQLVLNLFF
jgi:hypothetical protein